MHKNSLNFKPTFLSLFIIVYRDIACAWEALPNLSSNPPPRERDRPRPATSRRRRSINMKALLQSCSDILTRTFRLPAVKTCILESSKGVIHLWNIVSIPNEAYVGILTVLDNEMSFSSVTTVDGSLSTKSRLFPPHHQKFIAVTFRTRGRGALLDEYRIRQLVSLYHDFPWLTRMRSTSDSWPKQTWQPQNHPVTSWSTLRLRER